MDRPYLLFWSSERSYIRRFESWRVTRPSPHKDGPRLPVGSHLEPSTASRGLRRCPRDTGRDPCSITTGTHCPQAVDGHPFGHSLYVNRVGLPTTRPSTTFRTHGRTPFAAARRAALKGAQTHTAFFGLRGLTACKWLVPLLYSIHADTIPTLRFACPSLRTMGCPIGPPYGVLSDGQLDGSS